MSLPLAHKVALSLGLSAALVVSLRYYASLNPNLASIDRWLIDFWCRDLPPFHGTARILFYTGLFIIAWFSHYARPPFGDSPLQAPELYDYTLPEFFSLEGMMKRLGRGWISIGTLKGIRALIVLCWFCCILGFAGSWPPIIVGLGMLINHGIVSGCIGTSHRWYVPVYSLLALATANGNGEYSLDKYFFSQYGASYPFPPPSAADSPLLTSGFARKLILVSGIATLFFGGVTKLINGGLAWMNGLTLAYYVSSEENGRSVILKNTFSRYRWFSFILSVASVGLELGSITALFNPLYRAIILFSAAGLHFGIWLTMWPNYFPQSFCYLFGMNWAEAEQVAEFAPELYHFGSSVSMAAWVATWICVFLCFVTLLRIEYWPVTGIPMYSFFRDNTYDYKFLRDAHQAQSVALEHVRSQYPNALAWSNLWIILRLKNCDPAALEAAEERKRRRSESGVSSKGNSENRANNSSESLFVNLKNRVTDLKKRHGVLTKQWRRTLHNVAAVDMASKPLGAITDVEAKAIMPGATFHGERWLKGFREHLRQYSNDHEWNLPEWADRSGELQLRCKLKDGYAILARVPWNPRKD